MSEHITEVDGLQATWRLERLRIEIMNVHNQSQSVEVTFAPGTDLAAARDRRPKWARPWDRIRSEFWMEYTSATGRNPTVRAVRLC